MWCVVVWPFRYNLTFTTPYRRDNLLTSFLVTLIFHIFYIIYTSTLHRLVFQLLRHITSGNPQVCGKDVRIFIAFSSHISVKYFSSRLLRTNDRRLLLFIFNSFYLIIFLPVYWLWFFSWFYLQLDCSWQKVLLWEIKKNHTGQTEFLPNTRQSMDRHLLVNYVWCHSKRKSRSEFFIPRTSPPS